ncbi:MAG TPA: glycosyltransferase family 4 protein [Gemmatimonadaceae bacterium]|jgi:glycosyltransferase involved in cell wall biosynthesis|nr:glycosyltransferase family 4 protein [Gemmatimonadaceae bacterium]
MRIVVINWQDRENPQAGGAETHLHELFGRLVGYGHEVSLVCAGWRGAAPRAELDGIQVYRVGTRHTYPLHARRHYESLFPPGSHDILVEDLNKIPLATPHWKAPPVVGLVHHLFGLTAFRELAAPLASAVWLAERPLPLIYRNVPFQAVSESTASDLVARGIRRENVTVIFQGVDTGWYTPCDTERTTEPRFAYLGRLKRYKGVHLVIRAFAEVRQRYPAATLDIAGAGDYRPKLERLTSSLDLGESVRFLGRVSEREKLALLRRSWALLFASPKEGWGITNLEAAACGTPVVASNSPGIRESVIDGKTGYLVPHGDIHALADALGRFAGEPGLVRMMGANGRKFAETFTWDRAATETEAHLSSVLAYSNQATHGG